MKKGLVRLLMLMVGCFCVQNLHAEGEMKRPVVVFETTKGNFEVTLFPDVAPKTVENFLGLAAKQYYNGQIFHRVIKSFMIQGGDPTGTGRGGESIWGGKFDDECVPTVKYDKPGLLGMANAGKINGKGTNGSQFFITTVPTPHLNGKHTIFGEVTKGYEVVQALESVKTGSQDRPIDLIKIIKIYPKAE
ncbi:MAG TPA: peptidylprolyl isomerase [Rhabdochlamydiaceae bacterium]|jgi:peptidylprolyl isomerase|nr:peptidylprolyl isomerase [Rhabdochlamydiaceae bacterium]